MGEMARIIQNSSLDTYKSTYFHHFLFQLNGALTIGTLDGANVEMAEEMGNENIFIFGMTVPEVEALKVAGYNAKEYMEKNAELAQIMEQLSDGSFSKTGNAEEFKDLKNNLMFHDRYLTFADYESYIAAQDQVNETYRVIWKISNFLSQTLLFCNFSGSSEMGQNGYSQCGVFGEIQLRPNYR